MQFSTLALAALASLASAQSQSPLSPLPSTTASGAATGTAPGGVAPTSGTTQARINVVRVANNGTFTFSPNNLRVNVGEWVQFQFAAGNHTVTQSTFDQPCQPINMHNSSIQGFHSGFVPAAASAAMGMFPTFTIQVNSTAPIWLYCAQAQHCVNGMVMVINEPLNNPNRTLAAHRSLAAQANVIVPGAAGGATGGIPGGDQPNGGTPGQTPDTGANGGEDVPAAAGMLATPSTLMLLAAAGFALLL